MAAPRRLIALVCYAALFGFFWKSPEWLRLDANGMLIRGIVVQIGGPFVAALICLAAARASSGSDRGAWYSFSAGSGLYFIGNLLYLFYGVNNVEVTFPALPEAAFFAMALFFAGGMFLYGKVRQQVSAVQVYNFVLIACAVMLASLFLLNHAVSQSVMAPFPTIVAFLYPALWFSVAASGLISLLLYAQGSKSFAFALLVVAVFAEAIADFAYALELLRGTYEAGGATELLWVASAGLIVWAGIEQRIAATHPVPVTAKRRPIRSVAEAAIPAVAIGIVLLSGSLTGALGGASFVKVSAVLAVAFAIFSGMREYWIIKTQRRLRGAIEVNRAELEKSEARLSDVLESTSESVLVLDREWRVVYFNRRAAETVDQPDKLRNGISIWELFPDAATSGEGDHYREAVKTGKPAEFEIFVNDRKAWLDIHAYPSAEGLSIFFRDVSEEKAARDEVLHLAHHDPLTGLLNRTMFQLRLSELVARRAKFAVILIDVDHFKEVNDTLGHPLGDMLLQATAKRLEACIRTNDLVARLGGDEFVIIAEDADAGEAGMLAQRFADAASTPHQIEGEDVRLGASIGIALADGGDADPDRIFRNADIALYAAKADARGGYRIFETSMEAGMQERQSLRADLRAALANGEFELYYQPLVDLRTERVSGFEALLRWRHPVRGLVSPDAFIPIAEESGMIVAIGEWVLNTACTEAMTWPNEISVAVNLSTREFASGDLAGNVTRALRQSGLSAGRLELEITETVLLKKSSANLEMLYRLRALGVRIALDDFGTGFSSLAYLQQFPFSKIKIDRSFISGLPLSDASQAIVRSVIGLGMALNMRVTAEGVETQAQYDWVKLGCSEAQGYFLSRPTPAAEVPRLIERLNARYADRPAADVEWTRGAA